MKLKKVFDFRGTKIGFMIISIVSFVLWTVLFFSGVDWMLANYPTLVNGLDVSMMLGMFIGSVTLAFIIAQIAKDGRGITYGIYGGLVGLVLVVITMRASDLLLAALVGLMAVIGGFNGGSLGEGFRRGQAGKKK